MAGTNSGSSFCAIIPFRYDNHTQHLMISCDLKVGQSFDSNAIRETPKCSKIVPNVLRSTSKYINKHICRGQSMVRPRVASFLSAETRGCTPHATKKLSSSTGPFLGAVAPHRASVACLANGDVPCKTKSMDKALAARRTPTACREKVSRGLLLCGGCDWFATHSCNSKEIFYWSWV